MEDEKRHDTYQGERDREEKWLALWAKYEAVHFKQ
jgi:hypothetical protein